MSIVSTETAVQLAEAKRRLSVSLVNLELVILEKEIDSIWMVNALKGEVIDMARKVTSLFAAHEQNRLILETIAQSMELPNNPLTYDQKIFTKLLGMAYMSDSVSLPHRYLDLKKSWLENNGVVFY